MDYHALGAKRPQREHGVQSLKEQIDWYTSAQYERASDRNPKNSELLFNNSGPN